MNNFTNSVVGQTKATEFLSSIHDNGRIPHALLFKGLKGCGKFKTVIEFLKLINNASSNTHLSKNIESLKEPFIKYIFPLPRGKGEGNDDGPFDKIPKSDIESILEEIEKKSQNPYYSMEISGANTIKISSIRDIRKFISFEYSDVKYRAIIIDNAHLMNEQSQNALLKNLEEPPQGIIFFLLTPYPEKLLTTIESRCWSVEFNPLNDDTIISLLKKYYGIQKTESQNAVKFSEGSLTNAIDLIEYDIELLMSKCISFLRFSLGRRFNMAFNEISGLANKNAQNELRVFISLINYWLIDVSNARHGGDKFYFVSI